MSYEDKWGGPAFPTVAGITVYSRGMTLRDWFAGQVIASVRGWHPADKKGRSAAAIAYEMADEMIAERTK